MLYSWFLQFFKKKKIFLSISNHCKLPTHADTHTHFFHETRSLVIVNEFPICLNLASSWMDIAPTLDSHLLSLFFVFLMIVLNLFPTTWWSFYTNIAHPFLFAFDCCNFFTLLDWVAMSKCVSLYGVSSSSSSPLTLYICRGLCLSNDWSVMIIAALNQNQTKK